MKKYVFHLGIGIANAYQREVLEFDDDITEEQLEKEWQEWSANYIDGGFSEYEE